MLRTSLRGDKRKFVIRVALAGVFKTPLLISTLIGVVISSGETNQKRRDFLWFPVLQRDPVHLPQLVPFVDQTFQMSGSPHHASVNTIKSFYQSHFSAHRFYLPALLS